MVTSPTTPTKGAIIQFIESVIITAILAGIAAASPLLQGHESINWQAAGGVFLTAFGYSLATGVVTYFKLKPSPLQQQSVGESSVRPTVTDWQKTPAE